MLLALSIMSLNHGLSLRKKREREKKTNAVGPVKPVMYVSVLDLAGSWRHFLTCPLSHRLCPRVPREVPTVNVNRILLGPLPSLTSSEEAAHKAVQEMQDICTGAWEHTFPGPCWCGPGMERGLWRNEQSNKSSGEHGIPRFIFLILQTATFCKSHASKALISPQILSGSFREEMSGLAKNLSGN